MNPRFDHQRAAELYLEGNSQREVAAALGVNSTSVCRVLRRLRVPIRGDAGGRPKEFSWEVAARRYRDGATIATIAGELGVTAPAVLYALKKQGVDRRRVGRRAKA